MPNSNPQDWFSIPHTRDGFLCSKDSKEFELTMIKGVVCDLAFDVSLYILYYSIHTTATRQPFCGLQRWSIYIQGDYCWYYSNHVTLYRTYVTERRCMEKETRKGWLNTLSWINKRKINSKINFLKQMLCLFIPGVWKYHAWLVRPGPISFRTSKKILFTCSGTSTMYKQS